MNYQQGTDIYQRPLRSAITESAEEYTELLDRNKLQYKRSGFYLQIGQMNRVQGWIIHLSVLQSQASSLIQVLLPYLIAEALPFKIPASSRITGYLLNGSLGYSNLGKIIGIYPPDDTAAQKVAKHLISLTNDFDGIDIPTDYLLANIVFTRYGSFEPVIMVDSNGLRERYIYDDTGKMIVDRCEVPFKMPTWVKWPFQSVSAMPNSLSKNVFKERYRVVSEIHSAAKGRVLKAIYLRNFILLRKCIVKEGRRNMSMDEFGRCMKDRLRWQFELHSALSGKVAIPKPLDYFEENGNTYLITSYVAGKPLKGEIIRLYGKDSCFNLPIKIRIRLTDILLSIVDMLEIMHHCGYVHRDVTPANFLIAKNGKVTMIDLELVYSFKYNKPDPPFQLGTFGFMAPEQYSGQESTIKEDIYSLGALMIQTLTNLPPSKFDKADEELDESLQYFIKDKSVVSLIKSCLSGNPAERPSLQAVKTSLRSLRSELQKNTVNSECAIPVPRIEKVQQLITEALMAFATPVMGKGGIWTSKATVSGKKLANEQINRSVFIGLKEGISGALYLLARAYHTPFYVSCCNNVFAKNCDYIRAHYLTCLPHVAPGLYAGSYGVALALQSGIKSGLLDAEPELVKQLTECLWINGHQLTVSSGVAGNGLALLKFASYYRSETYRIRLQECAQTLVDSQQRDGSWLLKNEKSSLSDEKVTGFSNGIAGIIYFLLEYSAIFNDKSVIRAVENGLQYLMAVSIKRGQSNIWYATSKTKVVNPWLNDGVTGIALTFLRAYEYLGIGKYKSYAEGALRWHPVRLVTTNYSYGYGMAGIGEVYLEASRILKSLEWRERADHIAGVLIHTSIRRPNISCFWLADDSHSATADFMIGNAGIIDFLMRYVSQDSLQFPLFSH